MSRICSIIVGVAIVIFGSEALDATADMRSDHQHRDTSKAMVRNIESQACQPSHDDVARDDHFEGLQIETSDITLHELFFETILQAKSILRIDHPQVDHIRSYCYRDVLIVVRQDLKTPRPTGWIQVNFVVADVSVVKEELDRAIRGSPVAQHDETERSKIVRIRLKPDVPRSNCRAMRLEANGPEGFMIGFDQFKAGTCKTQERQTEGSN